jgi:hypothetical protein
MPTTRPPIVEQAVARVSPAPPVDIEPAVDPVHRLKARLGGAGQALAAVAAVAAVEAAPAVEPRKVVLASAIYVTGSRGLQAGSRYGIAVAGDELQILGPVDVDPTTVKLVHALSGIDATGLQGRLIITMAEGRRDKLALIFMSVAGGTAEAIADAILAATAGLGTEP